GQRIALLLSGALVKVEGGLPLGLEHVARGVNGKDGVQPVETGIAEVTLVDVPGNKQGAVAPRGRAEKDAGASRVAIAGFKIGAVQFPLAGHAGDYIPNARDLELNPVRRDFRCLQNVTGKDRQLLNASREGSRPSSDDIWRYQKHVFATS